MGLTKRRVIGSALGVLAVLAAVGGVLLLQDDNHDPVVSATPGTATTVQPTTTTIPGNHVDVTVATATDEEVTVLEEHPDGAQPTNGEAADWVELPDAELASRPAIPREGFSSAGVRDTPEGWSYDNPTYFDNPLTLMVLAEEGDWLEVVLPARPNGQTGWVHVDDVTTSSHDAVIEITLGERMLRAWVDGEEIVETPVVVGTDATPTPVGTFYLTEKIPQSGGGGSYGPWVLATNGYSEAMDLFDGGLPVIAMHGTNAPGLVGTAASNGCIRVPNEMVTVLAEQIPEGTPIQVMP